MDLILHHIKTLNLKKNLVILKKKSRTLKSQKRRKRKIFVRQKIKRRKREIKCRDKVLEKIKNKMKLKELKDKKMINLLKKM